MRKPLRAVIGVACVAALLLVIGLVTYNLWPQGGPNGSHDPTSDQGRSTTTGTPPSGSNPATDGPSSTVAQPPTNAAPSVTYLADLTASVTTATTTGSCTTAGRTFTRSLVMSPTANSPARVDYLSLPVQYTTLTATIGPVDTTDPNRQYNVRVFVQTGRTPASGTPNIVWDKTIPYGTSETITLTIRRSEFLRVQASTGTPRQACLGDIRLTP